jgi:hypothetical protein
MGDERLTTPLAQGHGLGDTVQFIRLIPNLRRSATRVIVWGQTLLLPLLATVEGIDELLELDAGTCKADYDADVELMELPHALRITPATLPGAIPYFHLGTLAREPSRDSRPCVGLVWQSGGWDARRSIPPGLLQQLGALDTVRFKILQRGPALASWRAPFGGIPVMENILAEAAQLRSVDLLAAPAS